MSKTVNPDLYDFLKEYETGLYISKKSIYVTAYVHIPFYALEDFIKVVGEYHFEEGGIDVKIMTNTICIDLNDIIESLDQDLKDYKNCFNESDWNNYEEYME
jgi:hypothetical protein